MNAMAQQLENGTLDATASKAQINQVVAALVTNWNRHDVKTYVAAFAENCDFVNAIGHHLHSRVELEKELNWLHRGVFRNSQLRVAETHVRFLSSDVAACQLHWEMRGHESLPGHAYPETRSGVFTLVLQRKGENWTIAAAQNTDFVEVPGL